MAFKLLELTRETSTSTTGAYVLLGAPVGYNPFSAGLLNNDVTAYTVFEAAPPGAPIWAEYFGTYSSGGNSLSRGTFIRSSTGADISPWGAGTRNIVCGLQGAQIESLIALMQAGSTGSLELVSGSPVPTFAVYTVSSFMKTVLDDIFAGQARFTLGLEIGVNVQAYDADLATIAGLAKTSGSVIRGTGSAWATAVLAAADVSHATPTTPVTGTTVEAALDQVGGFFAAGFYKSAASGDLAVPTVTETWAHGLGVAPKLVRVNLKCTTNDGTYLAGDVLYNVASAVGTASTGATGFAIRADATNVYVDKRLAGTGNIDITSKGGNGGQNITEGSWRLSLYAYA